MVKTSTLSEALAYFRVERPSEFLMDDFKRDAIKLEQQVESLERERDALREALEWVMKDYEGICSAGFVPSANWKRRVDLANEALSKEST